MDPDEFGVTHNETLKTINERHSVRTFLGTT